MSTNVVTAVPHARTISYKSVRRPEPSALESLDAYLAPSVAPQEDAAPPAQTEKSESYVTLIQLYYPMLKMLTHVRFPATIVDKHGFLKPRRGR